VVRKHQGVYGMVTDFCNENQASLNGYQIKVFSRPFIEYSPTYTPPHHQDSSSSENLSNVFELNFSCVNFLPSDLDWKIAAFGRVITHGTGCSARKNELPNTRSIIALDCYIEYMKDSSMLYSCVRSSAMEWLYPDIWRYSGCLDFDMRGIFESNKNTYVHWHNTDYVNLRAEVLLRSEDSYWLESNDLVSHTVVPDIALHILHRQVCSFMEQRYPM
jgi:hypothetical protein